MKEFIKIAGAVTTGILVASGIKLGIGAATAKMAVKKLQKELTGEN